MSQCSCFQCLKESFIKAEGTGLSFGLQNLEFIVDPDQDWPPPLPGVTCYSGTFYCQGYSYAHIICRTAIQVLSSTSEASQHQRRGSSKKVCLTSRYVYICFVFTTRYVNRRALSESDKSGNYSENIIFPFQHCVSVAIRSEGIKSQTPIVFSVIAIRDLLDKLHPPTTPTINLLQFWEEFRLKRESPISVTPDLMTGDNVIIDR